MSSEESGGTIEQSLSGDPLGLGAPAPAPEPSSHWNLTFGRPRGTKTPITFRWGAEGVYHEELNVASGPSRSRFANGAIRAAELTSPHLEVDPDEIIAQLARYEAPVASPNPPNPEPGPPRPKIANHAGGVALGLEGIDAQLAALVPGWPKRVGNHLFVADPRGIPEFLDSATKLFSWMDESAAIDWAVGPTMISEARYHAHHLRHAERHEGIDVMPHQPQIPGIFYMTPSLPGATESSGALDEFVDFFCPETELDRELIKAMTMTPAWGGPNGGRPAFLVTSPEGARHKGTGRGKSTLVQRVAELHGGSVAVDQGTSVEALKTRLLSPVASTLRILMLDNVKSHKFSWGALEALITDAIISGRENYVGEGRRPNILTTFITLNGARLSVDLARRVVTILMGLPEARATWEAELSRFLAGRRWHVLADIRSILAIEPPDLGSRLNYAPWESGVLAHVASPEGCQDLLLERRGKIDADEDERASILGMFNDRLIDRNNDPDTSHVSIPKAEVARWLSETTRENYSTAQATNAIKLLGIEELSERHTRTGGTWVWRGGGATSDDPKPIVPLVMKEGFSATSRMDRRRSMS